MLWLKPSQEPNKMSCACNSSPCRCLACDPEHEPLASALNNFITAFFGSLTKTCVNGQVSWVLPCDLEAGLASFPRNSGEGIACYFLRYVQTVTVGPAGPQGPPGDPLAPGTGFTGAIDLVTGIDYTSPNLFKQVVTLTYDNGILKTVSAPVNQIVTTAATCP